MMIKAVGETSSPSSRWLLFGKLEVDGVQRFQGVAPMPRAVLTICALQNGIASGQGVDIKRVSGKKKKNGQGDFMFAYVENDKLFVAIFSPSTEDVKVFELDKVAMTLLNNGRRAGSQLIDSLEAASAAWTLGRREKKSRRRAFKDADTNAPAHVAAAVVKKKSPPKSTTQDHQGDRRRRDRLEKKVQKKLSHAHICLQHEPIRSRRCD